MSLTKVPYTNGVTVIGADNLNNIQDAIIALQNGGAISDDLKQALLQIAQKVAYIDDQGQTYYQDLYDALYPPATLVSIDAVFTQGSTVVYDTASLDSLKSMLVVTATYDDSSTEVLQSTAYTLSGTLTPGTSTVTVTYNSLTTTFTVTVTAAPTLSSISAVYTQSGTVYDTDSLDSLKTDLVVTATYSDSSTQTVPTADYTLSGTLTAGTSTITVSYGGKTTTFSATVTAVIYSGHDLVFNNANPVNTGLTPLTSDRDITIAIDAYFAGQQSGTTWKLFGMGNGSAPYDGVLIQSHSESSTDMKIQNISDQQQISDHDYRNYVGDFKYIVTHKSGSGKWHYYYKYGSSPVVDNEVTSAFASIAGKLVIGGTASSSQVFNGTVKKVIVYPDAITSDRINAWMG